MRKLPQKSGQWPVAGGQCRKDYRPLPSAFSLMELMVVVGIMAFLATMAAPALNNTVQHSRLTAAGQALVDQFNLARQTAVSRNTPVEVRLYMLPSYRDGLTGSPNTFRAVQSYLLEANGAKPLDKPEFFGAPVILSPGAKESPLLNSTEHPEMPAIANTPFSEYGQNYRYRAFQFTAGGAADLQPEEAHLTLLLENKKNLGDGQNFFTVQINPISGSVRTFRP